MKNNELLIPQDMIAEIREIMAVAKQNVVKQINNELLSAYWNIGRVIVKYEQNNSKRAKYGKNTMKQLSKLLTKELGKGFSMSNIYNMRQFYLDYPIFQSLTGKLTWTHYCLSMILMAILSIFIKI